MIFYHEISPILIELGPLAIRWYGLLFALGITANYFILKWIFEREKYSVERLDSLVVWLFVGLVLGARLGEVFFYEPGFYLANPVEILKIWKGGLASHGAAIGLFVAFFSWCKYHKIKFSKYVNAIVVPMPLTAAFIRMGNFFNSEILGYPTGGDWGVVFVRTGDLVPRHPVQLYSSLMNLVVFAILFFVYKKYYKKMPPMSLMFLYLGLYFAGRFIVEFWKDLQGPVGESIGLTTGQVLSLVPVSLALGYFIWLRGRKRV